ncbi:unnamed protein product [Brachionus calyciflorus]|uniref:Rho GTPase-activating protein 26 n=1 Tax=Brachionus calyciflorus TaxID=104777 RepID=A0A813M2B8_9BILA|nr:unnamed protein product [Brachionus calyciflorus]
MVQIQKLDHLEYKEAILDSPEFREKLKKHEKHINETNKNIKNLLKKFEDVLAACDVLQMAQDSFATSLKEFPVGFVGDTNEEESDLIESFDCTFTLFQDIKEFSNKMINTGQKLIKQIDDFRKEKLDDFKDKKKEYERQTIKYNTVLEKYLQSSQNSKKDKNSEEHSTDSKENDRIVSQENSMFYKKCLDYVLCIQEFEDKWLLFFAQTIFAFVQNWKTFYHEGHEKYVDYDERFKKSQGGIQALSNNFEYFKLKSKEFVDNILKSPDYYINNSSDQNISKQGYLYLLEKKTLGSSTRVKHYCKYYKENKKLEVIPYNQSANKPFQIEVYFVNNCQKSSSDKRFVFDVSLRDKSYSNIHTYQAISYDDYKAWFAVMDGKELTPVLSNFSIKSDPVYILDRNGINFIKRCIQLLEDEKIKEEGIYRKNGVSHKINQFIEKNFVNIQLSLYNSNFQSSSNDNLISESNNNCDNQSTSSSSFIQSVLKSANLPLISHSSSFSTISFNTSQHSNDNSNNSLDHKSVSPSNFNGNNSKSNSLINGSDPEDTCTITSALKHYLIHLKEPLMTFESNQQFLAACRKELFKDRITEIHRLLHSLPPLHFEAIELLIKHLYKVSKYSQQNKMTTSNLATCFGPTVFRTQQECVSNLYNIKFYSEIVELLIINQEHMFTKNVDAHLFDLLSPIKSPPSMLAGAMTIINNTTNGTDSPKVVKLRKNNPITANMAGKRLFNQNLRNTIMNASKTSVSSDSSQSDKEFQSHSCLIPYPLTTSSPTQNQRKGTDTPTNLRANNSTNLQSPSSSLSSPSTSTVPSPNFNGLNNSSITINAQAKPARPSDNNLQKIAINNSNLINLNRSSTPSLTYNACGKNLVTSPSNQRSSMLPSTGALAPSTNSTSSLNSNFNSPKLENNNNSPARLKRARTLYNCEADNPSELSFEANVIIFNVRRSKESGWLEATYNGKHGLVPGNYVQILDE